MTIFDYILIWAIAILAIALIFGAAWLIAAISADPRSIIEDDPFEKRGTPGDRDE